ncbi:hypothetical protein NEUTE1DRAFT_98931 [Neurospora tetrasperma FGSC 2508]|uniref:Actin-like ATPase domain-containing protein n=1 Tax=Neurospora tetrasperma (strain FGSC 2508 / ATCC MYA-4615 / P0657) TaxID=510951 RepID=F8MGY8_NEUT8|nr:uncharacterized protein NEUTE1DRAFT_98931 [Neurospora tetrasperma FGSC 2508]EGO58707.1 hypothetical protein NEUTE1DRAFT_98931 [Neurospora tetrasperma FGSC 2508]
MTAPTSGMNIPQLADAARPRVVVALDLGSSLTRVIIQRIGFSPAGGIISKTFASHGYPFDDHVPVYMGDNHPYDRESVSLKYAFYILANAADKFVDEYPMIQRLRQEDSQAFRQKLRTGILELLREVRGWIFQNPRKDWAINNLPVSMPAQWGVEFEDVVRDLIREAFEWNKVEARNKVGFRREADGLTHYILNSPGYLDDVKVPGSNQVWLVIDFGGHNLNASLFWVRHNEQGPPQFFRLEQSFGAGGGTEHVLHGILVACATKCLNQDAGPGHPMCPAISEQIREAFTDPRVRGDWGPAQEGETPKAFSFGVPLWEEQNFLLCTFDQDEITQTWNEAHKAAFELVDDLLKNLRRRTAETDHPSIVPEPVIFIAGGSTKNKPVKRKLMAMVQEANLPAPVFLD